MSGFIFIINQDNEPINELSLNKIVDSIKSKGEDRKSIHIDNNVGLGHTLFKTTFESEYDRQPLSLDENIWIVSSGRIDGRNDLVRRLGISKKIDISRTPDSELILYAYKQWGEECTQYLIGDFAFVIWDKYKHKVFCARDRFGMSQLYYVFKNNTFIVSNSLYSIRQHPKVSNDLNDRAVGGFLLFADFSWMDKSITMFKDVHTLEPSHQLSFQNNSIQSRKYWDIPQNIPLLKYKNEHDYIEHFMEVFKIAVEDRIRTSSVVVFMSGGMDSSTVAATMRMIQRDREKQYFTINAFTRVYNKLITCDERYYATIIAKKLNIPIHYSIDDEYKLLNPYIATSRPLVLFTPFGYLNARKEVMSMSRVILTGIAADNVLNYSSGKTSFNEIGIMSTFFKMIQLKKLYGKRPPLGTGIGKMFKYGYRKNRANHPPYPYPSWLNSAFERKEGLKEIWDTNFADDPTQHNRRYDQTHRSLIRPDWNTDDYIMKPGFVLPEQRDPYLDTRLIEFISSVPSLPWLYNKHILRSSMKNILPNEIISRPKTYLNDIGGALLNQEKSQWIDNYKLLPELQKYIQADMVPQLTQNSTNMSLVHTAIRPLILSLWLNSVKNH